MYSKAELSEMAQIKLIEIAKEMGISRATRLEPQDLVYKILDRQASNPESEKREAKNEKNEKRESGNNERKGRRTRLKPTLIAESSVKNPSLHVKNDKRKAKNEQPEKDNVPEVNAIDFNISEMTLPSVPTVPEVLTPSGRLIKVENEEPKAESSEVKNENDKAEKTAKAEALAEEVGAKFDNAFRFLEAAIGQSQELVLFVTEITAGFDTAWFVGEYGCEAYFRHNRELLFDETRRSLLERIGGGS